jgi:hypothetical protein
MPFQTKQVDLSAVGETVLVPFGNRITGISVLPPRTGAAFVLSLDIGNSQVLGPITTDGVVRFSGARIASDVREGLKVINDTAQAGVIVPIVVSYDRGADDGSSDGGAVEFGK